MKKVVVFLIIAGAVAAFLLVPGVHNAVMGLFGKAEEAAPVDKGVSATEMFKDAPEVEGRVYVIRNGDTYHRRNCPECKGVNLVPRSIEECKVMGLKPCPVCKPAE